MTHSEPDHLPLDQLHAAYASREISPVDVLERTLEAAYEANEKYNAFVYFDEEGARASALESERRWKSGESRGVLDGVPISLKDTLRVGDWPEPRNGSHITPGGQICAADGPLASHIRNAGSVMFARTLTSEFGWKGTGDCPLYGATRNPWDTSRTPGGSSAGAAVCVAANVTRIAHGGDGGGSLRIPANFSGVFGMKPTANRLPGITDSLGSLSNQGVLTTTAKETAAVYDILSAPYPTDSHQLPFTSISPVGSGVEGMKIGFTRDYGFEGLESDVAAAVDDAARVLEEAGAQIIPIDVNLTRFRTAFGTIWASGFRSILGTLSDSQRNVVDPGLNELLESVDDLSIMDLHRAYGDQAVLSDTLREVELEVDLILSATSLTLPPLVGQDYPHHSGFTSWLDWAGPTWIGNLSRRPAASVPFSFSRDGLPIGVQLMGPLYGEREILRASHTIEEGAPFASQRRQILQHSQSPVRA